MTATDKMVYVAADPNQPGSAWAIMDGDTYNDSKWRKHMAKTIADWVEKGAIVQYLPVENAKEMLMKWKRPQSSNTQIDLF